MDDRTTNYRMQKKAAKHWKITDRMITCHCSTKKIQTALTVHAARYHLGGKYVSK